jgi:hypothetical protein
MVARFRRRLRVAKGLYLNVSKSGASVSTGRRGLTVNYGPRGRRITVGIPGSGLSYSETARPAGHVQGQGATPARSGWARTIIALAALITLLVLLHLIGLA